MFYTNLKFIFQPNILVFFGIFFTFDFALLYEHLAICAERKALKAEVFWQSFAGNKTRKYSVKIVMFNASSQ